MENFPHFQDPPDTINQFIHIDEDCTLFVPPSHAFSYPDVDHQYLLNLVNQCKSMPSNLLFHKILPIYGNTRSTSSKLQLALDNEFVLMSSAPPSLQPFMPPHTAPPTEEEATLSAPIAPVVLPHHAPPLADNNASHIPAAPKGAGGAGGAGAASGGVASHPHHHPHPGDHTATENENSHSIRTPLLPPHTTPTPVTPTNDQLHTNARMASAGHASHPDDPGDPGDPGDQDDISDHGDHYDPTDPTIPQGEGEHGQLHISPYSQSHHLTHAPDTFFTPPQQHHPHRKSSTQQKQSSPVAPIAPVPAAPVPPEAGTAAQAGSPPKPSETGWISRAVRRLAGVNRPGLSESSTPLGRTRSQKPPPE